MQGRGGGKTRSCCEWLNAMANRSGVGTRIFLAARTAADVRDTIIEGESGLLAISRPDNRPVYKSSKRAVVWPSGAKALCFSAEEPDQPRGPQYHYGYADEVASWDQYGWEFWSNLMFGLRLKNNAGQDPQCVASTTPKPTRLMKWLVANSTQKAQGEAGKFVHLYTGSTYDNMDNLPQAFRDLVLAQYAGTRLGNQEILGQLLTDVPGALWDPAWFEHDGFRCKLDDVPQLPKCVVGVDPAASSKEKSANTGIITAATGTDGMHYVLKDSTLRGKPAEWGAAAILAYKDAFEGDAADHIVAEANNGGEMVRHVLSTIDGNVPVKLVHASRGKQTRAEPVSALYQKGQVKHVGIFADLEDQMTTWVPGEGSSPDRVDALVWAISDMMARKGPVRMDPKVMAAQMRRGG